MKRIFIDIAIIGGGPAGLAAAVEAKKQGTDSVGIIERDIELGGILNQCIHDGFGLHRFKKQLSGAEYAQNFIDEVEKLDIDVFLNTMVLEITKDKEIYVCNKEKGMFIIKARAVILSMGCRERTASQVQIHGSRPAGVMTAGTAQRYINIEGYLPGTKAVILGSGDIGLIMARRMTFEGIEVAGVYEIMPQPGGLNRNIVQCLRDYNIPLHLSTTVAKVHGKSRIEGVTVAKVDPSFQQIEGSEEYINCDLLILAVGLIPENELTVALGIEMDSVTKGPVVDENFMTSLPGFFAAGNVVAVFDLVDYVSATGEIAARGAVDFINQKSIQGKYVSVTSGENISFVIPQRLILAETEKRVNLFMRVKKPQKRVDLVGNCGGEEVYRKRYAVVAPPEMIDCTLNTTVLANIELSVGEVTK